MFGHDVDDLAMSSTVAASAQMGRLDTHSNSRPSSDHTRPSIAYSPGHRVQLKGTGGTVRFMGRTQFAGGIWAGVELDEPFGKCDGSFDGISYFGCLPDHGVFVRPSQLEHETDINKPLSGSLSRGSVRGGNRFSIPGESAPGFRRDVVSRFVQISADGLTARHETTDEDWLYGVVFGREPIPRFTEGAYFEIRVEETRYGPTDGLVVGITVQAPKPSDQPYETADEVPRSWSLGYDGAAHVDEREDMLPIPWSPASLHQGDIVGFLLAFDGCMCAVVNGRMVAEVPVNVPQGVPLYAVVDILGRTTAVSIKPAAAPPPNIESSRRGSTRHVARESRLSKEISANAHARRLSQGFTFDELLVSKYVAVSPDGLSVRHKSKTGSEFFGAVFGNMPLQRHAAVEGHYFEVRVDGIRQGAEDGLTLGVTTALPRLVNGVPKSLPASLDEMPGSWSVGYDGQAFFDGIEDMLPVDWNPKDLRVGDRVGLHINALGQIGVFVNGQKTVQLMESRVPVKETLYPMLDLLGNTSAVTLLPDAVPPRVGPAPIIGNGKLVF